jgi:hypothetical protein
MASIPFPLSLQLAIDDPFSTGLQAFLSMQLTIDDPFSAGLQAFLLLQAFTKPTFHQSRLSTGVGWRRRQ